MSPRIIFKITDYIEPDLKWEEEQCRELGVDFSHYQMKNASPAEILGHVSDADILLVNMAKTNEEVIDGLKNVKVIIRHGIGYDNLDVRAATGRGIVCANQPTASSEDVAEQAIIDLGLPPGFDVETEDLARLVARFQDLPDDYPHAQIKRFELTGRQIILYVKNLNGTEPLTLSYRLRARFPLVAQTPASMAYDYYNPGASADAAPQTLTVVGE